MILHRQKGWCPLLTQIWAFELCTRGLIDSQNEFDPHGFTLIDEMYLLKLQPKLGFYAGDFATIGDAVLQMAPYILEPKVHCEIDKHGTANSLCTVVMRVEKTSWQFGVPVVSLLAKQPPTWRLNPLGFSSNMVRMKWKTSRN